MEKRYEKPVAEIIDLRIIDGIMDVTDYSEGAGEGDSGGDFGDE